MMTSILLIIAIILLVIDIAIRLGTTETPHQEDEERCAWCYFKLDKPGEYDRHASCRPILAAMERNK